MVFLFIAFCGIIFLFCVPIKVEIAYLSLENGKKRFLCFYTYGFGKSLALFDKNAVSKLRAFIRNITKNSKLKFKADYKKLSPILRRIRVNRFSVQIRYSDIGNAAVFYPLYGVLSYSFDRLGDRGRISFSQGKEYCQAVVSMQFNIHLILSSLLQILRPSGR